MPSFAAHRCHRRAVSSQAKHVIAFASLLCTRQAHLRCLSPLKSLVSPSSSSWPATEPLDALHRCQPAPVSLFLHHLHHGAHLGVMKFINLPFSALLPWTHQNVPRCHDCTAIIAITIELGAPPCSYHHRRAHLLQGELLVLIVPSVWPNPSRGRRTASSPESAVVPSTARVAKSTRDRLMLT